MKNLGVSFSYYCQCNANTLIEHSPRATKYIDLRNETCYRTTGQLDENTPDSAILTLNFAPFIPHSFMIADASKKLATSNTSMLGCQPL